MRKAAQDEKVQELIGPEEKFKQSFEPFVREKVLVKELKYQQFEEQKKQLEQLLLKF